MHFIYRISLHINVLLYYRCYHWARYVSAYSSSVVTFFL